MKNHMNSNTPKFVTRFPLQELTPEFARRGLLVLEWKSGDIDYWFLKENSNNTWTALDVSSDRPALFFNSVDDIKRHFHTDLPTVTCTFIERFWTSD